MKNDKLSWIIKTTTQPAQGQKKSWLEQNKIRLRELEAHLRTKATQKKK